MSGFALRDGNIGLWVVVGALLTSAQTSLNRQSAGRITRDLVTDSDVAMVLGGDAIVASEGASASADGSRTNHASQPIEPASAAMMKVHSGSARGGRPTQPVLAEGDASSLSRLLLTLDLQKRSAPLN